MGSRGGFFTWVVLGLSLGLVSIPQAATAAGRVFLNGVDITGVRDQLFQKSTVRIDASGDIFIEAAQYTVKTVPAAPAAPVAVRPDAGGPNQQLSLRYYLVTQPSPAAPDCELTVSVNGQSRRTVKPAATPQLILEISAWLHPGDNDVHISGASCSAPLTPGAAPARLIVGRGHDENRVVKIDEVLLSVPLGSSTTWPVSERRLLSAK